MVRTPKFPARHFHVVVSRAGPLNSAFKIPVPADSLFFSKHLLVRALRLSDQSRAIPRIANQQRGPLFAVGLANRRVPGKVA